MWLESEKRRDHSENLGVNWKIILKWIARKSGWRAWTGFCGSG
jgi:hypothetical protein